MTTNKTMTNTPFIDSEERDQLEQLARSVKDVKTALRIRVILALDKGYNPPEVASLFLLDESTIKKWRNKFRKRKLFTDWLSTNVRGYSGKLSKEQEAEISSFVEAETVTDCKEIVSFIKKRYDISYTTNGVTKLLHRLGFVYKQTTLVPGKLDEEAQKAWLKGYENLKSTLPEDEVILFGDGVHPTKAWIRRGEQKPVPTNTGRKRLNGVLNIEEMEAVVHYADTLNAQTTMELLDKIQEAYLRKRKCRMKIHWLPPYSPNLNFIERLWHFMKKYIIGIKRRESFKEFEQDIHSFFDNFKDYEDRLKTIHRHKATTDSGCLRGLFSWGYI
jgi:transposase